MTRFLGQTDVHHGFLFRLPFTPVGEIPLIIYYDLLTPAIDSLAGKIEHRNTTASGRVLDHIEKLVVHHKGVQHQDRVILHTLQNIINMHFIQG